MDSAIGQRGSSMGLPAFHFRTLGLISNERIYIINPYIIF